MSYKITYTDKYSGEQKTHINRNNEADAVGWAKSYAASHNCKAVCVHVDDGPYSHTGKETHIASVGDKK
jgi:hypothetical protein